MQCLAFPTDRTRCIPTHRGFDLRPHQDITKKGNLPMRTHHARVLPKKAVRPLDLQRRQPITTHELLSWAAQMPHPIIAMRQKTHQIRAQPGSRVTHDRRVIPELGESFDGVDRRKIGRIFDLRSYNALLRSFFI
jgi:hypothetical protein